MPGVAGAAEVASLLLALTTPGNLGRVNLVELAPSPRRGVAVPARVVHCGSRSTNGHEKAQRERHGPHVGHFPSSSEELSSHGGQNFC